VGTIAYMSPEQARALELDARTDIWSLGVVLYEMIAGRTPFAGTSTSDVLAAILDRDPPPLARFDPEAPPELQRIVGKALRKDRSQRYQTVQDLLLDLQALREDLQSPTRPWSTPATPIPSEPGAGGTSQTVPPVRQRRSRAGPAVAAAVLVLGAVLGVWAWRTARTAQTPASEMAPQVQRNLTRLTFGSGSRQT
jgi:eukaryotic-like serine/threonine-protein kinase